MAQRDPQPKDRKPELSMEQIMAFLQRHEQKRLLRFVTIGSVDDGKSTLIGRLLYESGGVFDDQVAAVTTKREDGETEINFANLTDGLQAEREQGITIDVAYRYSSTEKRKFIIADTPGHVQYTRNMATGASTADAAIILIDARLGVLQQSRRHAYIANLLGIPNLLVAVNKMDLVDYRQDDYEAIVEEFRAFADNLEFDSVHFFPVSALAGDNIVENSARTPWWKGTPLLGTLEELPIPSAADHEGLIFPVQLVLRPDLDFRGYAGTLAGGTVRPGDEIKVLPSGKTTKVQRIVTMDGDLDEAFAPQSVCLTLEDEIDISRGDVLTNVDNELHISREVDATVVWMNETPLEAGRQYIVKHTTNLVSGTVSQVFHRVDMDTLEEEETQTLQLNDVGKVRLSLNRPLILEEYRKNKVAGSFIIVDRLSNATMAAGMIHAHGRDYQDDSREVAKALTPTDRAARFGQKPTALWFTGRAGTGKIVVARALERRLFDAGHNAYVLDASDVVSVARDATGDALLPLVEHAKVCAGAGQIVISTYTSPMRADRETAKRVLSARADFLEIAFQADLVICRSRLAALGRNPDHAELAYQSPEDPDLVIDGDDLDIAACVDRIVRLLEARGLLDS